MCTEASDSSCTTRRAYANLLGQDATSDTSDSDNTFYSYPAMDAIVTSSCGSGCGLMADSDVD